MLLDTSGLFCLFDADDFRHAEAGRCYDSATVRLTHNAGAIGQGLFACVTP